jgi:hypothetical protein
MMSTVLFTGPHRLASAAEPRCRVKSEAEWRALGVQLAALGLSNSTSSPSVSDSNSSILVPRSSLGTVSAAPDWAGVPTVLCASDGGAFTVAGVEPVFLCAYKPCQNSGTCSYDWTNAASASPSRAAGPGRAVWQEANTPRDWADEYAPAGLTDLQWLEEVTRWRNRGASLELRLPFVDNTSALASTSGQAALKSDIATIAGCSPSRILIESIIFASHASQLGRRRLKSASVSVKFRILPPKRAVVDHGSSTSVAAAAIVVEPSAANALAAFQLRLASGPIDLLATSSSLSGVSSLTVRRQDGAHSMLPLTIGF